MRPLFFRAGLSDYGPATGYFNLLAHFTISSNKSVGDCPVRSANTARSAIVISRLLVSMRDSEPRLAKMRRQLEEMFRKLDLLHDEITVAADAARSNRRPELDNMLRLSVAAKPYGQLEMLTKIIERLGGKTGLSEEGVVSQVVAQQHEARN